MLKDKRVTGYILALQNESQLYISFKDTKEHETTAQHVYTCLENISGSCLVIHKWQLCQNMVTGFRKPQ